MSETSTLEVTVAAKSDTGLIRKENQDRMTRFYSPFGEIFLVADGMGGHKGGARAAAMVEDGFTRHVRGLPPDTPVELAIRMAAEKTNTEVFRESRSGNPETAGMGATLVLAILRGNDAVIAHVGDSRAYLFRAAALKALTRDHTRGQDKIEAGLLTEEDAWNDPDSSVLTRAFGHSDPLAVDISSPIALQSGDRILLCSDGLCGYVKDKTIAEVLAQRLDAKRTAEQLVKLANEAGGEDNITVQVILVGSESAHAPPANARDTNPEVDQAHHLHEKTALEKARPLETRRNYTYLIVILSAVLLAAMVWGGYQLDRHFYRSQIVAKPTTPAAAREKTTVVPGAAAPPLTVPQPAAVAAQAAPPQTPDANLKKILLIAKKEAETVKKLLEGEHLMVQQLPAEPASVFPQDSVQVLVENPKTPGITALANRIHDSLSKHYQVSLVAVGPLTEKQKDKIDKKGDIVVIVRDTAK